MSVEQQLEVQEKSLWDDAADHIELPADGSKDEDHKGVVYLGRIPYGFFEEQMLEYFSQFGEVTRLRLARNKKVFITKQGSMLINI